MGNASIPPGVAKTLFGEIDDIKGHMLQLSGTVAAQGAAFKHTTEKLAKEIGATHKAIDRLRDSIQRATELQLEEQLIERKQQMSLTDVAVEAREAKTKLAMRQGMIGGGAGIAGGFLGDVIMDAVKKLLGL